MPNAAERYIQEQPCLPANIEGSEIAIRYSAVLCPPVVMKYHVSLFLFNGSFQTASYTFQQERTQADEQYSDKQQCNYPFWSYSFVHLVIHAGLRFVAVPFV
jgi:hypothetical protein